MNGLIVAFIFIICTEHVAYTACLFCAGSQVCVGIICYDQNDGKHSCVTKVECADQTSRGGCRNGKCDCVSGYGWVCPSVKCLPHNDNTKSCGSLSDCYQQDEEFAACINSKCTCKEPSTWVASATMCSVPNSGEYPCPNGNLEACQVSDPLVAECSASQKCVCKLGYTWSRNNCLTDNDEGFPCSSDTDCADITNGYCDGVCKCNKNHQWDRDSGKCLCIAGTSAVGPVTDCQPCSPGMYQPDIGQEDCLECDPGYYQHESGKPSCTTCPQHSESLAGQEYCDCVDNYYFDPLQMPEYCPSIL